MKLIIQIPCYNEATTLPLVLRHLPKQIPGIREIEYQIIDDGSTDGTAAIARSLGVHHIVTIRGRNRRWLGRAFRAGVDHALRQGADVLVNTDGDNQYPSNLIPALVRPIIDGRADVVIGDRSPATFQEFSRIKRFLQWLGSWSISKLTGEQTPDAVSGFRAYSRSALMKINITTNFTYTVDTLMQAQKKGLEICWLPITPNSKTRESRLITSIAGKVRKSGGTIIRVATTYEPVKAFSLLSVLFLVPGLALLLRFFYYYLFVPERASGFLQSIAIGCTLLVIGTLIAAMGVVGMLLGTNRQLIEDNLERTRMLEQEIGVIRRQLAAAPESKGEEVSGLRRANI